MLGAIAGDIIGSVYEHHPIKTEDFPLFSVGCRFTDDTVMTVALAHGSVRYIHSAERKRRQREGDLMKKPRWRVSDRALLGSMGSATL